ncbi:hypothetical protein GOP47_0003845 [Adiantum capillus-veneris]|uniref:Uncharacterized protein n=1 Tax=Adiantum capillus-veneris TaxID=13818 RepID=A0A9D4ZNY4_ADICA|nr:hypothetical protein GOP47_0003845 [Adiantum capillus-veneris]
MDNALLFEGSDRFHRWGFCCSGAAYICFCLSRPEDPVDRHLKRTPSITSSAIFHQDEVVHTEESADRNVHIALSSQHIATSYIVTYKTLERMFERTSKRIDPSKDILNLPNSKIVIRFVIHWRNEHEKQHSYIHKTC